MESASVGLDIGINGGGRGVDVGVPRATIVDPLAGGFDVKSMAPLDASMFLRKSRGVSILERRLSIKSIQSASAVSKVSSNSNGDDDPLRQMPSSSSIR